MHYYGDTQQEFTESALPGQPEDEEHLKFFGSVDIKQLLMFSQSVLVTALFHLVYLIRKQRETSRSYALVPI